MPAINSKRTDEGRHRGTTAKTRGKSAGKLLVSQLGGFLGRCSSAKAEESRGYPFATGKTVRSSRRNPRIKKKLNIR